MGATRLELVTPSVSILSRRRLSNAVSLVKTRAFSRILPEKSACARVSENMRRKASLSKVRGNFVGTLWENRPPLILSRSTCANEIRASAGRFVCTCE
jgi:hypothetical protein